MYSKDARTEIKERNLSTSAGVIMALAWQIFRQNIVTAAICLASATFIIAMMKSSQLGTHSTWTKSAQSSLQIPGDHFTQLCASILRSTLAPQQQSVTTAAEVIKKSMGLADRLLEVQEPAVPAEPKTQNTATASVLDKLLFRKPSTKNRFGNITLTGLVFFGSGRMQRQRIVQCYIERNLVSNGGLLAEVIWQIRETSSPEDFAFLQEILDRQPKYYKKMVIQMVGDNPRFKNYYTDIDPSKYYVKLDDDIVWVADGAIEAMLEEKLRGRFLFISANVINHCRLSLNHARMGILDGYVPSGPGIPWQKLGNTSFLDKSPAAGVDGEAFGNCWGGWECAAVQVPSSSYQTLQMALIRHHHYNFFAHHKAGTLEEYKQSSIYDYHARGYERWSINFILFKGSELGIFEHGEDEQQISMDFPEAAGKHCGAVGKALVVHYAYGTQYDGLSSQPDILSAYRVIAEKTCGSLIGHD